MLQRVGHQSSYHAHLIVVEGSAFIIVPIVAGVLEQCVRKFTTFSFIMILMAMSIAAVMRNYNALMRFTDRPTADSTKHVDVLDNVRLRQFFVIMSVLLAIGGLVTFLISAMAGRT